jgi:hypothetical protein
MSTHSYPLLLVCRDMLRFADADEAEAVYSMVSLTQAAHRQQQCGWQQNHTAADVKGPVIEVWWVMGARMGQPYVVVAAARVSTLV